jgi:hypothetical protein
MTSDQCKQAIVSHIQTNGISCNPPLSSRQLVNALDISLWKRIVKEKMANKHIKRMFVCTPVDDITYDVCHITASIETDITDTSIVNVMIRQGWYDISSKSWWP